MDKVKLKTIDVWDTILRRKCHPDYIKRSTAYYFYLKYYKLHLISSVDKLFDTRVSIERSIGQDCQRRGFDDEYLISDVFLKWVNCFINSEIHDVPSIALDLYDWEFKQEKKSIYLDPTIEAFLEEYPSEETIFLSDFYMSSVDLEKLLTHAKINKNIVSSGISSADILFNKRSGKLFDYVSDKFNISPGNEDWIHIGDNEWSDVKVPASKNIKSIRYLPTDEHGYREYKESLWGNNEKLIEDAVNNIIKSSVTFDSNDSKRTEFAIGLKAMPLIAGFTLKILETAIDTKSERIYFFTREGEFFIKAFELLIEYLKTQLQELDLPVIDILEVSRLSTFAPSLQEISLKEMMRIWNLYSTQSVSALFKTLNVNIADYVNYVNKYKINPDEDIIYPWQDERIQNLFNDSEFKDKLWHHILTQRSLLMNYFETKGLSKNKDMNVCVVDVGWRGTIHDNIALLYPNIHFTGVYLGLQTYLNEQPANTAKVAFGPNINLSVEFPHFLDSVAPIEMITNSPSGSVIGYTKENNEYVAIRKIDDGENKSWYEFTRFFQDGILTGLKEFYPYILDYGLTHHELRDYSLRIWETLINGNNKSLMEAFNNLNHNETFGVGTYINKKHVPSLRDICNSLWDRRSRQALIGFIKSNQWSDGIRGRQDINWAHKHILGLLIDFAVFYKHRFYKKK
ncbi:hypothetical protein RJ490_000871 [Pluralibacter gergoviae]|nr:hypothetical protein [Pluralibacter gergoviae]ELD4270073.1 hypothetical protein [Pluralibacter gergoviae]ELD4275053.1 hypothetical protein [Pluralibacter gergoviae]ELD4316347.1 hypothetical protein [Pluralibacter gergoviae]ELD4341063.1 hypothetical protein [Pluralibacter gergoviae]